MADILAQEEIDALLDVVDEKDISKLELAQELRDRLYERHSVVGNYRNAHIKITYSELSEMYGMFSKLITMLEKDEDDAQELTDVKNNIN